MWVILEKVKLVTRNLGSKKRSARNVCVPASLTFCMRVVVEAWSMYTLREPRIQAEAAATRRCSLEKNLIKTTAACTLFIMASWTIQWVIFYWSTHKYFRVILYFFFKAAILEWRKIEISQKMWPDCDDISVLASLMTFLQGGEFKSIVVESWQFFANGSQYGYFFPPWSRVLWYSFVCLFCFNNF